MKQAMINFSTPYKFMEALNPNMITENKGILYFNTGIWGSDIDNAMPQFLINLLQASSIHSNLCQLKYGQILGNNLDISDDTNTKATELAAFIKKRNLSGDNLKTVYAKACRDFSIMEAASIQVLYANDGSIESIFHIPVEKVRMGIPDKYNRISEFYISNQWAQITNSRYKKMTANNSAARVPAFNPNNWKTEPVQLLYISKYSPSTFYAIPNYVSAINWILIDNMVSTFEISNLKSNYFMSGMLTQIGNPTPEEMNAFINDFQNLYKGIGTERDGKEKMIFNWIDSKESMPEFTPFTATTPDFDKILNKAEEKIIFGHSAFSEVTGISRDSGLGNDGGKSLYVALQSFTQLVCAEMKETLVDGFNRVLEVNGYDNLLTVETDGIKTTQPVAEVTDLSLEERRRLVYGLDTDKADGAASEIIDETPSN